MNSRQEQAAFLGIIAAAALIWMTFLALTPQGVFWTTDGGNKFIIMENIAQHSSLEINYPAAGIDPEHKFFPRSGHHFQETGGKIYSFYPPYFPVLSLPLYKAFGFYGLYGLPVAAGLLCLFACRLIGMRLGLQGWRLTLSVALMGFGTPLLFYAASFWEQTPALLFSSLALFFSLKVLTGGKSNCTNFLLAGFMLGLSTMLREEGYVILAALSCGFLLCGQWRRLPLLMAGWGLVMMPVWIFQYFHYGSIFGAHAAVYSGLAGTLSPVSLIAAKLKNFYVYLFCFGGDSRLTILLVSPFIIASLAGFFKREFRLRRPLVGILLWLCAGSGFVMLVRLLLSHTPVFDCIFTQALFTGTPFLVFFLLGILSLLSSTRIELRFASAFCVAYILGACLLLNQSDMGIIWGARHFLALFPFLLPLCLIVWDKISPDNEKRKIVFSSAFFLIALSVLIQCHGLRTLFLKLEASAALKTAIEASPQGDPVLSDIFWLPEEMGTLFHKRVFLQVNTKHGLAEALQTLKDSGIRSFTMLLSANPDYRVISKDEMGKCLSLMDISPGPEIASPGAEFMRCQLFFCKFK